MAELLKIEGFATKEIALSQKPINEVLKESQGVLISYSKANVSRNLKGLVKKNEKEITDLIALEVLTTKQEIRLIEIRKYYKDSRIALDKITKHNSSVLAQASKSSKVIKDELVLIIEPVENKITERLENEEKRRENARIEKENAEIERKAKLQLIVDGVAADLQSIIDSTKEFSDIEENEKQFNSILSIFDNSIEEKQFDLKEYDVVYDSMVSDKSETFDSLIKSLTTAYELEKSNRALKVAELTNTRMNTLFDYDFKYKGEKPLGELTSEEYVEIVKEVVFNFRVNQLLKMGLTKSVSEECYIYSPDNEILVCIIEIEIIKTCKNESWELYLETFQQQIEDYNNPKEPESVPESDVNEIEVVEDETTKTIEIEVPENANNEIVEFSKDTQNNNSEFDKEAKQNLENTISFEPKDNNDKYIKLFNYLESVGFIKPRLEEMQEIERIVLNIQK